MSQENVEIVRQVLEAFQQGLEHDDPGAAFDTGIVTADAGGVDTWARLPLGLGAIGGAKDSSNSLRSSGPRTSRGGGIRLSG